MLSTKNLSLNFQDHQQPIEVFKNLNLEFPKIGLSLIYGPSGCGKTSLLLCLAGILKPRSGQVFLNKNEIAKVDNYKSKFGFIFQAGNLINYLTAYENIVSGMKILPSKNEVLNLSKKLKIEEKLNLRPSQLSGGQKQRVAIARALIKQPEIIFADEPTSALDLKTGQEILQIFKELSQTRAVILVSHNPEVIPLADKLVKLG